MQWFLRKRQKCKKKLQTEGRTRDGQIKQEKRYDKTISIYDVIAN